MTILGFNAYAHDAGVAILEDGRPVFAAEEERFNRAKKTTAFPAGALAYARGRLGLEAGDVDVVAFPWRRARMAATVGGIVLRRFPPALHLLLPAASPNANVASLVRSLGARRHLARAFAGRRVPRLRAVSHHLAHAANAFFLSPCDRAAVLVADAFGDDCSTSIYEATGTTLRPLARHAFFNSLGVLYSMITRYLGFRTILDEGKVMALASYGTDELSAAFRELVRLLPDGRYAIDERFFGFQRYGELEPVSEAFVRRFGPARLPEEPLTQRHMDVARALQVTLEESILHVARHLRAVTGARDLCLGGGIALNCLANARLAEEAGFARVYVSPSPNDAGVALGAALALHYQDAGRPRREPVGPYLGPTFGELEIARAVRAAGLVYREHDDVAELAARELAAGRLVGWFQGAAESGPRALGNRSILGDPRDPFLRDRLNARVKRREWFRPYAPSVLAEHVDEYFTASAPSPHMSFAARVRPEHRADIPAVLSRDGTARLHAVTREANPLFRRVIQAFWRATGVPMVLNTSFNCQEPLVGSPSEALRTFATSGLDVLVMGRAVVTREAERRAPRPASRPLLAGATRR
jgi:carbamoyltransferase